MDNKLFHNNIHLESLLGFQEPGHFAEKKMILVE